MSTQGRTGSTGNEVADITFDVLTQTNNKDSRDIQTIKDQLRAAGIGTATSSPGTLPVPSPANPFIVEQDPEATGMRLKGQVTFPPVASLEYIAVIYRQTSQDSSKDRTQTWTDIQDADAQAGLFTGTFDDTFDFGTTWGLSAVIIKALNGSKQRNPTPPDNVNFLTMWVVGQAVGAPSPPSLGSIVENALDTATKRFSAFISVQVIAPSSASAVLSGQWQITINSNVAVGTATLATTQAAVGQGFLINGEEHIITAITDNTHITFDFPWKQSLSGQTATVFTLKKWSDIAGIFDIMVKFRLFDDPKANPITKKHSLTSDEMAQSQVTFRVDGFIAVRKYIWTRTRIMASVAGNDVSSTSTVTFIAGGFTDASAGIPELTSPAYHFDNTTPYNGKQRHVSVVVTQPNPPVALFKAMIRKFANITGTVQVSNGQLIGSGTIFTQELAGSDVHVGVGLQELTISSVVNDTLANISGGSSNTSSGQVCTASQKVQGKIDLETLEYHPLTGGQIEIVWGDFKTAKLTAYLYRTYILAQNGQQKVIDGVFTSSNQDENVPIDTAVPGGLVVPTFFRVKKTGTRIAYALPTTNWNTPQNNLLVIASANAPANGVKVLTAADLSTTTTLSSTDDTVGRIDTGWKHATLPIDQTQLEALFGASNIFVWFYSVNSIGPSLRSPTLTYNLTTGEASSASFDSLPPQDLGVPTFSFFKGTLHVANMTSTTQSNFLTDTAIVLTQDGVGIGPANIGPWFDLPSYITSNGATIQQAASESAAQYHIGGGKKATDILIRLRDLEIGMGNPNGHTPSSATPYLANMFIYFYKINQVGSTASPLSIGRRLDSLKDPINSGDVGSGIVAGGVSVPGRQIFPNSDFLLDNSTAGHLGNWTFWDGTLPITSNGDITTVSADTLWNQGAHNITISASGVSSRFKVINIRKGRIQPGQKYCVTFQAKSSGTPVGISLQIRLRTQGQGTDNIDNPGNSNILSIPFDGTGPDGRPYQINTSFQEFGAIIKIRDTPNLDDGTGSCVNQWMTFILVGNLGGQTITLARMMFNDGQQPAAFSVLESEEGVQPGTGVVPNVISPQADVANVIGSAGGWQDTQNQGRLVIRAML